MILRQFPRHNSSSSIFSARPRKRPKKVPSLISAVKSPNMQLSDGHVPFSLSDRLFKLAEAALKLSKSLWDGRSWAQLYIAIPAVGYSFSHSEFEVDSIVYPSCNRRIIFRVWVCPRLSV
ncbi:hypothetical protein HRR90_005039 [Exophiala dermatitidis]|nr:hypothetical protein HRR73_009207 [Exophiala dermatitidis]KAJ4562251.1 hypothetical protein HRR81_009059 [Exophiala dermatitidis]KAJ4615437.1 hypothetical protein HRR86_007979 [Exophiala dermatitidis]KAJ4652357.1 hypothetical protein HRR90_005039 [Exophiala dermatitidis]KAJ4671651.1 hypothetical protein HRR95_006858 [Exophiala dermatitidis]